MARSRNPQIFPSFNLHRPIIGNMIENLWVSLNKAAEYVDVSKPTILRRAFYFNKDVGEIEKHPCPKGMVRYKKLKLGDDTRQERRYYVPDLRLWLN